MSITKLFKEFFDSEKSSGTILVGCTIVSVLPRQRGTKHITLFGHLYMQTQMILLRK